MRSKILAIGAATGLAISIGLYIGMESRQDFREQENMQCMQNHGIDDVIRFAETRGIMNPHVIGRIQDSNACHGYEYCAEYNVEGKGYAGNEIKLDLCCFCMQGDYECFRTDRLREH